ncbi:MAG: 16S rRNA (adenine(1518)-N(6)/adenine(1519)-N(6))-dimethyltransferase RsmA [Candidatus Falkowbacteria bacterium]
MNNLLSRTLELCKMYEIYPSRSKGQNFLINEKVYDDIIVAADLKKTDIVLEVGPGLGFLTEKLAANCKKLVAVELDDKIFNYLQIKKISQKLDNVELLNSDILQVRVKEVLPVKYKVVANLPYNITSIFLRTFLESDFRPQLLVLMLQKEVAERITAKAGEMSLLALSIQYFASAEIIEIVPASDFYPAPKVDSAIVKIDTSDSSKIDFAEAKLFFRLARIGFSAKRKMLKKNLGNGVKIPAETIEQVLVDLGLDVKIRAQDLSLSDWKNLFAKLRNFML